LLDGRDHPSTPRGDNPEAARAYSNTGPTMATLPVNGTLVKTSPRPFYRTKRGIIIIIVVVVAIVVAIVGGAVGGSKSKTSSISLSQPNGVDTATTALAQATTASSFLPVGGGATSQYSTASGPITSPPSTTSAIL